MLFCLDKPESQALRAATRPVHLTYVEAVNERILTAGPILDERHEKTAGSLLVIDFASRPEAEMFVANDPYSKAGLFEKVEIRPFKPIFPKS